jgi:lysophospholipase L1-like esterase
LKVQTFLATTRKSKEAVRQSVKKWIRTSGSFDAVSISTRYCAIRIIPADCCRASQDHLHSNDVGYQVMADAIDLALFK